MKIVNFKKFIRSIMIILFIILGLSMICAKASLSYKEIEYTSLYVDYGDTLWSIASRLQKTNNYYKEKDIRYIIYDIKKINNLNSSDVYIAQELKIPTI